ncbi:DUF2975 domain-containing protein [Peijinzhouia sedimentorum]
MKQNTATIMIIMHVIAWVIFIGFCIKTGALIFSALVSFFINPAGASDLYLGLDLSNLFDYDKWHYGLLISLVVFISGLQAYIFYLLIKIFMKLNLVQPFSQEIAKLITKISYVALEIAILHIIVSGYSDWLVKREVIIPSLHDYLGGASEFLLLGGIIFVIAQIFKRGLEIQAENELTI